MEYPEYPNSANSAPTLSSSEPGYSAVTAHLAVANRNSSPASAANTAAAGLGDVKPQATVHG